MTQIIEGLDNEVTFILFFFTLLLAVVLPLYVFKPNRRNSRSNSENSDENEQVEESSHSSRNTDNSTDSQRTSASHDLHRDNDNRSATGDRMANEGTTTGDSSVGGENEMITVRVMLHETSQTLTVAKSMLLKDFKKKCYPTQYEASQTIRLICAGHILNGESNSLSYLGISNGSVLHSVISSQAQQHEQTNATSASPVNDLDLSEYFVPIISVVVMSCWVLIFNYSNFFSTSSITIFGFLSAIFLTISFYR